MKIELYLKSTCPYCIRAREWFKTYGLEVQEINVDDNSLRNSLYDRLGLKQHQRTVPQIIVDGKRIGGFTDLVNSEFARMIQAQAQSDKL